MTRRTQRTRKPNDFFSSGWKAAKTTGRHIDSAAVGLARWASTDHSGFCQALADMPKMGIWDTLRYIAILFLIRIVGALVAGFLFFLLIAIGVPLLISAIF